MAGTAVTHPGFPPASPANVSVHPLTTMHPDRSFSLSPAAPLFGQPFLWQPKSPPPALWPVRHGFLHGNAAILQEANPWTLFSGERKRIHSSGLNIRASIFRTNPARGSTLALYNSANHLRAWLLHPAFMIRSFSFTTDLQTS